MGGLQPSINFRQFLIAEQCLVIKARGLGCAIAEPEGHDVERTCQFADLVRAPKTGVLIQVAGRNGLGDGTQPKDGFGYRLCQQVANHDGC